MIQLLSLAFGPFAQVEPLNPDFAEGHPKLRLIVDGDPNPGMPDAELQIELERVFPGLTRHQCRDGREGRRSGADRGVVLLEGESTANQAHLLEHLLLEFLDLVDPAARRSGVTCAYESPRERSDVFVECREAPLGRFLGHIAVDSINAALARDELSPLYPDALRCARPMLAVPGGHGWNSGTLARSAEISPSRAGPVLQLFERTGVVRYEPYAMNFSGEPHYRFVPDHLTPTGHAFA